MGTRRQEIGRRNVNRSMFWRLLRRSVFANRGRLIVILLALGAGATVTAALLNLQVDAKRRITTDFRAFGPNVLVTPRSPDGAGATAANTIDQALLEKLQSTGGVSDYAAAPYLYLVAKIRAGNQSREGVISGTHLDILENREPSWLLQPEHPTEYAQEECVAGSRLADRLQIRAGAQLLLASAGRTESCTVAAILSSGGPEDDQVFVPLAIAQRLAGTPNRIGLIKLFVSGDALKISEAIRTLQEKLPNVEVRPVRQFTEGEARLYSRISGILTATVSVVLLLTALCVMAAMTNIAAERKNDVGLMKAIGGSVRRVLRIFLAEAALLGLAGGALGAAVGIAISMALGKAVFGVAAQPRPVVYPVSIALTVAVAVLAAYPLRRLALIRPAAVFRGEE